MGDNQVLREQIAQAIHDTGCAWPQTSVPDGRDYWMADSVLPVVQAHEKALRDELTDIIAEQVRENDDLRDGISKLTIALASLRDAVAQLADQLDRLAESAKSAAQMAHTVGALGDEQVYLREQRALEYSADRLRSLLPQEGQS